MVKQKNVKPNIPFKDDPFPQVAGLNWCVQDIDQQKIIIGKNTNQKIQFAPATKMMNFYTCLYICEEMRLNEDSLNFIISQNSKIRDCVTAQLPLNLLISPRDLYYALMLQGGNDAALALAENYGFIYNLYQEIDSEEQFNEIIYNKQEYQNYFNDKIKQVDGIKIFLEYMNKLCLQIGMNDTQYMNVTGLSDQNNLTTIEDVCKLSTIVMQNTFYVQVVSALSYEYSGKLGNINPKPVNLLWKNSNQLIYNKSWNGIKTGWTPESGHCIATQYQYYKKGKLKKLNIIIGNAGGEQRKYIECELLVKKVLELDNIEIERKLQNNIIKSILIATGVIFLKSII